MSVILISTGHQVALVFNRQILAIHNPALHLTARVMTMKEIGQTLADTQSLPFNQIHLDLEEGSPVNWDTLIAQAYEIMGEDDRPLGLDDAMSAMADDDDLRLWEVEVGLYDLEDDPRTPFDTKRVAVAAEDQASALQEAPDIASNLILTRGNVDFQVTGSADMLDPSEFNDTAPSRGAGEPVSERVSSVLYDIHSRAGRYGFAVNGDNAMELVDESAYILSMTLTDEERHQAFDRLHS